MAREGSHAGTAVNVRSDVRMNGVLLKEGDRVEQVDPQTGLSRMDTLEDERAFDTTEIERRITAPHSNRLILEELKRYADEHERRYGRFPKTLVFAANGLPHTSHADQLVDTARDVFGRGDAFVEKITGRVAAKLARLLPHALVPANLGAADQAPRMITGIRGLPPDQRARRGRSHDRVPHLRGAAHPLGL